MSMIAYPNHKPGYLLELYYAPKFEETNLYKKVNELELYDYENNDTKLYEKKFPKRLEFPFEDDGGSKYWNGMSKYDSKFTYIKSIGARVFVPAMQNLGTYTDKEKKEDFKKDAKDRKLQGTKDAMLCIFTNTIEKYDEGSKNEIQKELEKAKNITDSNKNQEKYKILQDTIIEVENYKNRLIFTKEDEESCKAKLEKAIKEFKNSVANKEVEVPVGILNAYKQGEYSMANEAIVHKAKITEENGKFYIEIKFHGIEVGGIVGHLEKLWIYNENSFTNENNKKLVTDVKYVKEVGYDGEEREYPSLLKFEIDPKFTRQDGEIYVQVFVDAMESLSKGMGTKRAILKIEGSKAKTWTGWPEEDKPIVDDNESNSSTADIKEIRGMLKDSLNTANAVSASKGADSFLTIAIANANNVLANPKASASEIRSAINNLNTASARNNPTGSKNNNANQNNGNNPFNNNSWGNNNNPWNNNNWGNNTFGFNNNNWGNNNNSSWGNNQNNNNQNSGPVTIQYEVPVEALNAYQSGVYSMANNAINHTARVEERNGQFRYSVQFVPMQKEFGGKIFTGHLYNFFIYDGNKYQAQQSQGNVWSWVMNGKYDKVKGAVWVDAMDEIAGKGPGGGEQDVILSFNWNNAKEVGRVGGNNNQQNQNQNQQNQNQLNGQNQNNQASSQGFTDINGHWAKKAIDYVVGKKYFAGLSKTEFGPNKAITRGQFVTVLGRMLNVDKSQYQSQKFSDVKADAYYGPYIAWASQKGIVAGLGGNNFAPDQELTREQMALIMSKFLKVSGKNLKVKGNVKDFKDQGQISSWAKDSINEMLKLGVVNGMDDGTFAPKQAFTRAQVAQVLYNIDHN